MKRFIKNNRPPDVWTEFLKDAINYASALGITTVGFVSCPEEIFDILRKLTNSDLKIRINLYVDFEFFSSDNFPVKFDYGDRLKIKGVKLFTDGSLGSRTALLSFPYKDDPGNRGITAIQEDELMELCNKAEVLNLDIATHAIGDAALDTVIKVYSKLLHPHRIEHAS